MNWDSGEWRGRGGIGGNTPVPSSTGVGQGGIKNILPGLFSLWGFFISGQDWSTLGQDFEPQVYHATAVAWMGIDGSFLMQEHSAILSTVSDLTGYLALLSLRSRFPKRVGLKLQASVQRPCSNMYCVKT